MNALKEKITSPPPISPAFSAAAPVPGAVELLPDPDDASAAASPSPAPLPPSLPPPAPPFANTKLKDKSKSKMTTEIKTKNIVDSLLP